MNDDTKDFLVFILFAAIIFLLGSIMGFYVTEQNIVNNCQSFAAFDVGDGTVYNCTTRDGGAN